MAEWQTQLFQKQPLSGVGVQLPLSAPMITIEYYMGRKNRRTTYWLYRRMYSDNAEIWDKSTISSGHLQWEYCNMLPKDMKLVTHDEAEQFLFEILL